jgi:hypothetical protein
VWSFFAAIPGSRFPANRRMTHVDLGPSRFGRQTDGPARFHHYRGRRIDLLMRALRVDPGDDPRAALHGYLLEARAASAKHLAAKGVVLIDPPPLRGQIVWPPGARQASAGARRAPRYSSRTSWTLVASSGALSSR